MLLYGGGVAWRVKGACRRRGWVIVLIGRAHVSLMARSAQGGAAKQENEKQGNQNSLRDLLPSMWLVMCKRPKETGMHIKRSAILAPPLSGGGLTRELQLG